MRWFLIVLIIFTIWTSALFAVYSQHTDVLGSGVETTIYPYSSNTSPQHIMFTVRSKYSDLFRQESIRFLLNTKKTELTVESICIGFYRGDHSYVAFQCLTTPLDNMNNMTKFELLNHSEASSDPTIIWNVLIKISQVSSNLYKIPIEIRQELPFSKATSNAIMHLRPNAIKDVRLYPVCFDKRCTHAYYTLYLHHFIVDASCVHFTMIGDTVLHHDYALANALDDNIHPIDERVIPSQRSPYEEQSKSGLNQDGQQDMRQTLDGDENQNGSEVRDAYDPTFTSDIDNNSSSSSIQDNVRRSPPSKVRHADCYINGEEISISYDDTLPYPTYVINYNFKQHYTYTVYCPDTYLKMHNTTMVYSSLSHISVGTADKEGQRDHADGDSMNNHSSSRTVVPHPSYSSPSSLLTPPPPTITSPLSRIHQYRTQDTSSPTEVDHISSIHDSHPPIDLMNAFDEQYVSLHTPVIRPYRPMVRISSQIYPISASDTYFYGLINVHFPVGFKPSPTDNVVCSVIGMDLTDSMTSPYFMTLTAYNPTKKRITSRYLDNLIFTMSRLPPETRAFQIELASNIKLLTPNIAIDDVNPIQHLGQLACGYSSEDSVASYYYPTISQTLVRPKFAASARLLSTVDPKMKNIYRADFTLTLQNIAASFDTVEIELRGFHHFDGSYSTCKIVDGPALPGTLHHTLETAFPQRWITFDDHAHNPDDEPETLIQFERYYVVFKNLEKFKPILTRTVEIICPDAYVLAPTMETFYQQSYFQIRGYYTPDGHRTQIEAVNNNSFTISKAPPPGPNRRTSSDTFGIRIYTLCVVIGMAMVGLFVLYLRYRDRRKIKEQFGSSLVTIGPSPINSSSSDVGDDVYMEL